jgi:hypothetical protein
MLIKIGATRSSEELRTLAHDQAMRCHGREQ